MSAADRPTISAELIASMIASTPDRVRRRLDRAPDVAEGWNWALGEASWSVEAGGETVALPLGAVNAIEQISCTCLLSPRCFHVLACLTRLEVALEAPGAAEEAGASAIATEEDAAADEDAIEPTDAQRWAACGLLDSVARLLRVGAANCGVVLQSDLLRAIHQCRAEGLHRLAALGLRAIAAIGEIRSRAIAADAEQLAEDLADLLETGRHLLGAGPVAGFWIGTARRKQWPVRPRRLLGLFAEPVVTRSGHSGAAVHFLGGDGRFYTASDVRPGDARRARDVYLGGIEIGPMVQSARRLARGSYLGTDLTASADGRLGRGKAARIVEEGPSSWSAGAVEERFRRPLQAQWDAIYDQASRPADAREIAWDFLFLEGTVLGAAGPVLLFQPVDGSRTVRLAIENESEGLCFRENLRMLSHAPGLKIKIIGRGNVARSMTVFPLAIAGSDVLPDDDGPRLDVPEPWGGRTCLGFDEIQRSFLRNARAAPVCLNHSIGPLEDPLGPLRRRWIARMLSGAASWRGASSSVLGAEVAGLHRGGLSTGAALLDALSHVHAHAPSSGGSAEIDTFLAVAIYLRACAVEQARFEAALLS